MHANVNGKLLRYDFAHDQHWTPPLPEPLDEALRKDKLARAIWRAGFRRAERVVGRTICRIFEVTRDPACSIHGDDQSADRFRLPCICGSMPLVEGVAERSKLDKNYWKEKGRAIALGRACKALWPDDVDAQESLKKQYANRPRPKSTPKLPGLVERRVG